MFAAATLVVLGVDVDDAWTRIERARGRTVPDVSAQREWLAKVAPLLR